MFGRTSTKTRDDRLDDGYEDRTLHERDDRYAGDPVLAQQDRFGGLNLGAAFFGWLVAVAVSILLTGIIGAIAAAVGYSRQVTQDQAERQAGTIGLVAAIVLLAVLMIGYYSGGYVAGRMSRFSGSRQGLGVWLIGLLVTIVAIVLGGVFGQQYDVLSRVDLPRLPVSLDSLSRPASSRCPRPRRHAGRRPRRWLGRHPLPPPGGPRRRPLRRQRSRSGANSRGGSASRSWLSTIRSSREPAAEVASMTANTDEVVRASARSSGCSSSRLARNTAAVTSPAPLGLIPSRGVRVRQAPWRDTATRSRESAGVSSVTALVTSTTDGPAPRSTSTASSSSRACGSTGR